MSSPSLHLVYLLAAERDPSVQEFPEYLAAVEALAEDASLQQAFEREKTFAEQYPRLLPLASFPADRIPDLVARMQQTLADEATSSLEAPAVSPILLPSRRPWAWAAAVAAAFLMGVWVSPRLFPAGSFNTAPVVATGLQPDVFRHFATELLDEEFTLDFKAEDAASLQNWLAEHKAPGPLPDDPFIDLPSIGCKVLAYNGQPATVVCFRVEDGRAVHLFSSPLTCDSVVEGCRPKLKFVGGRATAIWREGGRSYLLVSGDPGRPLDRRWFRVLDPASPPDR